MLPLALTPLAALVPNGIQRYIILALAALYFGACVVLPNLPSSRMKKLEQYIDETAKIHAMAVRELDKNPRFIAEASLRLAQVKFAESVLRSKTLGAKDIPWKQYAQYLRCLSLHIGACQRDVHDIRASLLVSIHSLECNRQRRYTEDITQRRTTLDTVFLGGSSVNDPGTYV
ncbi:hypothetical protein C8R44DRAFT_787096 [Mycena epipterygia]|nr:hypothetical protein C8R44DRAFT_787096 [Mycena epipterygia]